MPDRKPPRLAGSDRETLLALLQFQRESVVRKVTGVDETVAATSPVASGTTLIWLVAHLARAESVWVEQRFAGDAGRDTSAPEPVDLSDAVATYRAAWARTDAIVAASDLDELCRGDAADPPVNLRWILAHLLEETARHAGHADVLRELIDGDTGR